MSTLTPEQIIKIENLLKINRDLLQQATDAITKWEKIQKSISNPKIENLLKINRDLLKQANDAIAKWEKKLQPQPHPVAASAASASGVPPVAPSAASASVVPPVAPSAAEEIKKKHLALLTQCGFITAESAKK